MVRGERSMSDVRKKSWISRQYLRLISENSLAMYQQRCYDIGWPPWRRSIGNGTYRTESNMWPVWQCQGVRIRSNTTEKPLSDFDYRCTARTGIPSKSWGDRRKKSCAGYSMVRKRKPEDWLGGTNSYIKELSPEKLRYPTTYSRETSAGGRIRKEIAKRERLPKPQGTREV